MRSVIVQLHQLDDALGGIGKALLALHDALELLLLDLQRLVRGLALRLAAIVVLADVAEGGRGGLAELP